MATPLPAPRIETVTQKDLARLAGVSRLTLQRALEGRRGVSAQTTRRLQKLARQVGYRVNTAARATRRGRFDCAALVLASDGNNRSVVPEGMIAGICDALAQRHMHLTVARLPDTQLTSEAQAPKILREFMADGLLINVTKQVPAEMERLIEHYRIPAVWTNRKSEADCVFPDDAGAGRAAVGRLLELGHRQVAYLGFDYRDEPPHYSVVDRAAGVVAAMHEAGLEPLVSGVDRHYDPAERLANVRAMLAGPHRPTAVVAYGQLEATAVMLVCAELGLRVPADLSLLCFGPSHTNVVRPISVMTVPEAECGVVSVEQLEQKIAAPGTPLPPRPVPFRFLDRGTTAPRAPAP